jgi:hypothetical protein
LEFKGEQIMKNKILMVIMTGISVFLSLSLIAADVYYSISPVDVYWHTGGNWTSSAVPTSADNVGITRTYAPTPVRILSGESYLVNKLTLSQGIVPGEDYLGGLWLEGTLTNTLSLSVGDLGPGRLLVDGGKVVTVNGSLQVGYDTTNAQGAFIMSNGVAVARADMRIGVSNGAQGEVSWVDSAAAVLGYLRVGLGSGTQGAFYLDNTTVNVYSGTSGPGAMRIGETGTGMVSQNGGELNLVGFLTIGLL